MIDPFIHSLSSTQRRAVKKRDTRHILLIYSTYRAMLAPFGISSGRGEASAIDIFQLGLRVREIDLIFMCAKNAISNQGCTVHIATAETLTIDS
jgi:hypothetical protein